MSRNNSNDFAIPENISPEGRQAIEAIMGFRKPNESAHQRSFWTPAEWQARDSSELPDNTVLVVLHEGSCLSKFFYPRDNDPYRTEEMDAALAAIGLTACPVTHWFTAIHTA